MRKYNVVARMALEIPEVVAKVTLEFPEPDSDEPNMLDVIDEIAFRLRTGDDLQADRLNKWLPVLSRMVRTQPELFRDWLFKALRGDVDAVERVMHVLTVQGDDEPTTGSGDDSSNGGDASRSPDNQGEAAIQLLFQALLAQSLKVQEQQGNGDASGSDGDSSSSGNNTEPDDENNHSSGNGSEGTSQ